MTFNILPVNTVLRQQIIDKIDNLTKPKGSLGRLEELALKICLVQQTLTPELRSPHNVLFAADHGVIEEGVSVSPKEVTWQQLGHFAKGGAGINFPASNTVSSSSLWMQEWTMIFPPVEALLTRRSASQPAISAIKQQ